MPTRRMGSSTGCRAGGRPTNSEAPRRAKRKAIVRDDRRSADTEARSRTGKPSSRRWMRGSGEAAGDIRLSFRQVPEGPLGGRNPERLRPGRAERYVSWRSWTRARWSDPAKLALHNTAPRRDMNGRCLNRLPARNCCQGATCDLSPARRAAQRKRRTHEAIHVPRACPGNWDQRRFLFVHTRSRAWFVKARLSEVVID